MQMKEEQLRIEESEAETRKRLKAEREHHKKWEAGREGRVGTWRTFAQGNKSKSVRRQPVFTARARFKQSEVDPRALDESLSPTQPKGGFFHVLKEMKSLA